ncbi:uncharacterized protein MAM_05850 [Metarhizium album ARSEF 1941]|uniref:Uncharacterized protein n=1 Tax=Metarhizium album (strain ARSEF 1941) TaxID=1081103 RepID=A0A0B2WRP2_METAS|nr:uncharacterized protein MAM_05850 [Metarhizium album ARSEF 1941]KHN96264.1 hypothetical protein MAM_05850 [Metarhizium album ARSEF 1941]
MESEPPFVDEGRPSRRGRFMDKLFGKDKKSPDNSAAALDAFLHSSVDNLDVTHPPPPSPSSLPKLAKLDTTISRYPQALAVNQQAQQNRPMAPGKLESRSPKKSPRPNKKGMSVRFADSYPDIIGEGGDESDVPTIEIGRSRRARPPQPPVHRSPRLGSAAPAGAPLGPPTGLAGFPGAVSDDFQSKPLQRTQTGYSSTYKPEKDERKTSLMPPGANDRGAGNTLVPGRAASARYLEASGRRADQRRSFIEIHQAQMREAEGKAFALAARTASSASQDDWEDVTRLPPSDPPDSSRQYPSSPEIQMKKPALDYSPAGSIGSNASSIYQQSNPSQTSLPVRQPSAASQNGPFPGPSPGPALGHPPPMAARSASIRLQDTVDSAGEDALNAFVLGTKHLFELFRLHAESVQPLSTCTPKDCARAALWWFLKGRMGLESAVRERPNTPQSQMQNELDRQQAYSNLAKGYWLCRKAIPEIMDGHGLAQDAELTAVSQGLVSALRKLSQSMKRNGFLPPEEPFLPQTIDKSIWLDYPCLSQDLNALLSGNWSAGLTAMQQPMSTLQLLEAFPLSDTVEHFSYGRVMADVFLMEQGRESQRIFLPCILSMVRPQKSAGLMFIIASQNGCVQLAIQENKNIGPVWEDLRWQNNSCAVEVRMPRGFLLVVQLSQNDYRTLWNMYDFGSKLQASLRPRSDEIVVFRNSLRSFQYLDADPQSRVFPKEAVPQCDLALFERIYKESGPAGPRSWHCGFRIAVVVGPRTRTISGIQHNFPPQLPVQFGFFRAEGDTPALSVRSVNGRQNGRMVFVFGDEKERVRFHSLLTGTALSHGERVVADAPLKSFIISQSLREPTGIAPFSRMPWKAARVVNDEFSSNGDLPPTVLADKLKIVLEYQNGMVADRVNVAPGELRMRLEVSNAKILRVLRQPQQDVTMSVSEAQVSRELPSNLADSLQLLKANQTIRSYEFNNLKDLHDFQAALTGFEVIFDALAATFAISRRRMVVPIHKKWEAGCTRIQVVKLEDRQLQLLAFFEDFQHGHCMNFVLKGTDVYETFQRGSKAGLKFVDAKFPLPQIPADKDSDHDDMAFICLDLPDLPGEHDDISIMFENETGEDASFETYTLWHRLGR